MTGYIISGEQLDEISSIWNSPYHAIWKKAILSCPLSEHDTRIRQEERNKILDELTCLIKDAKETRSQRRIEMFHYTGLYSMIESLRKNVETDNIESDNCKYLKGVKL